MKCKNRHTISEMASIFWFLALLIQGSLIYAEIEDVDIQETVTRENVTKAHEESTLKNLKDVNQEWLDMFLLPGEGVNFSPAAAKMALVTKSDKTLEEQLEEMKDLASQISLEIQREMANLLSYALQDVEINEKKDNMLRKKRSIETPMDSTQMVMRLLKHIKSNNEYQNIAIEKMMTAQEIADKYGIEFNPDTEILTDLAIAANEQAQEMTSILNDALTLSNKNKTEFIPIDATPVVNTTENDNETYYTYSLHIPVEEYEVHQTAMPHYDYCPDVIQSRNYHQDYSFYPETQMMAPPVHQHHNYMPQSTPMPNFYEPMSFFPSQEFYPMYSPMEPVTTTTTIVLPFEDHFEPEPELVGEEFEETVTSKVYVDHEEPGEATVNHVMTYTVSEKSHFKQPKVEKMPQQMQYYFFLV